MATLHLLKGVFNHAKEERVCIRDVTFQVKFNPGERLLNSRKNIR
ncbi:hypothetical protein PMNALOAF_4271 [Methylobacterium adhaesivum]|nr:hypothetical protein PMNALOAF_4271 [Methylobacterium adhaesivum]